MKNVSPANNTAKKNVAHGAFQPRAIRNLTTRQWKIARSLCVSLLLLGIALVPMVTPFAQRKDGPVKVTGVSSHKTGDGAVVTVSADAPLTRTQTWQDDEGFHLVMTGAGPGLIKGLPRGVTVRNLGKSLEVVVAVKPGAGVTVDPRFNNLNLIVTGGLDTTQGGAQLDPPSQKPRVEERAEPSLDYAPPVRQPRERRSLAESAPVDSFPAREQDFVPRQSISSNDPALNTKANAAAPVMATPAASSTGSPLVSASPADATPQQQLVPATDQGIVPAGQDNAASTIPVASSEESGLFSYIFSTTGVLVLLLLCGVALLLVRRRRITQEVVEEKEEKNIKVEEDDDDLVEVVSLESPVLPEERPKKERRKMFRRKSDQSQVKVSAPDNHEVDARAEAGALEKRAVVPVQPALYGAYRVDQEVGKLVLGQAHRLDVLSSRAPDDRRAIETSLLKALNAAESGDEGRRRAREALEEYGFVARQCASLLLSHNAYDRASSARMLGEINSAASLPFLLEALYDTEGIVRAEAVTSLGALKMPSAIGALIDMARRYPEMPAALLSRALSACSVECLDFFDTSVPERPLLETGDETAYAGEITHLDPAIRVEELPEWFEDEEFTEALAGLQEGDAEVRSSAARRLAQFQAQRSVEALTVVAANDVEAAVRAAAVTSLGEIEHESVFAPVIMAFADEAREVRAAAARSLSRMSFDRGEAYVRLIETADAETLLKVAQSCTKAGMVAQAIDRLISEDRRLAYEAFSLLSLLAKAGETEPLVEAISSHPEVNVRLAIVRLVGTSSRPEAATLLRHLAVRDGLPEKVRSALLEVVYKIDQAQLV
jgi:HEAT repeat protein